MTSRYSSTSSAVFIGFVDLVSTEMILVIGFGGTGPTPEGVGFGTKEVLRLT
jgi:hypothetical protein